MPSPDPVHWQDAAKVFEELGFVLRRDYPEVAAYQRVGTALPVTLPKVKNVKRFILLANCKVAGISEDDFFRRLHDLTRSGAKSG